MQEKLARQHPEVGKSEWDGRHGQTAGQIISKARSGRTLDLFRPLEICLFLFWNTQHPSPTYSAQHLSFILEALTSLTMGDLGETVIQGTCSPSSSVKHVTQCGPTTLSPRTLNLSGVSTKTEKKVTMIDICRGSLLRLYH